MNKKLNRILIGVFSFLAALAGSQTVATAQTVTLTLIAPASSTQYPYGNNASAAGVYLSPYYFNVTTTSPASTSVQALICDDFSDDISLGESWSATVYNNGQIPSVNYGGLAASGVAPTQADYEEIGYLAYELMQPPIPTTGQTSPAGGPDQAALSFAIWSVLEPNVVTKALAQADLGADYLGYTAALSTANNIANNPENSTLASIYLNNLTIYQPVPGSQSSGGTPQQFVGVNSTTLNSLPPVMPEALSPTFLAFDLLILFVAVFLFRRGGVSNAAGPR